MRWRALIFAEIAMLLASTAWLAGCITINAIGSQREFLVESVVHGEEGPKILLVEIDGEISDVDFSGAFGIAERESTTARLREQLDRAREQGDIRALLLRINSPGGSVTASDIIYHELLRFKEEQKIPVVAELMGVAASGGYYAAMAADEVIAHPTTVTGSIGVLFSGVNFAGLMEKVGIEDQTLTSGAFKDSGSPLREMTPEERAQLQSVIDDFYLRFRKVVADGRGLSDMQLDTAADGRVFTALQALDKKLIDRVGYLEDAVKAAEKRAGLPASRVVSYHRPREWRENLYFRADATPPEFSPALWRRLWSAQRPAGFYYLWLPIPGQPF